MSISGLTQQYIPPTLDGLNVIDADQIYIDGKIVDLDNLVPYIGSTKEVDLNSQNIKTTHNAVNGPDLVNLTTLQSAVAYIDAGVATSFLNKVTTNNQTITGNVQANGGFTFTQNTVFNTLQLQSNDNNTMSWTTSVSNGTPNDLTWNATQTSKTIVFRDTGVVEAEGVKVKGATALRAVVTDANKNLATSATTATEIAYLSGVTSGIQTQINGKLSSSGGAITGPITWSGTPSSSQELTTKQYVDSLIAGTGILSMNNTWTGTNAFSNTLTQTLGNYGYDFQGLHTLTKIGGSINYASIVASTGASVSYSGGVGTATWTTWPTMYLTTTIPASLIGVVVDFKWTVRTDGNKSGLPTFQLYSGGSGGTGTLVYTSGLISLGTYADVITTFTPVSTTVEWKITGINGFMTNVQWTNLTISRPLITINSDVTMNKTLTLGSNKVTTSYVPVNGEDLTNKTYVDGTISLLDKRYKINSFVESNWVDAGGPGIGYTYQTESTAPVGNQVMYTDQYQWLNSTRIPIDITKDYTLEFWIRRNGANAGGASSSTVYLGCAEFDSAGTNISGDGSQWYYGLSGIDPVASWVDGRWYHFKYVVGPNGGKVHASNGRFISLLVILNYTGGRNIFQMCGFKLEPVVPFPQLTQQATTWQSVWYAVSSNCGVYYNPSSSPPMVQISYSDTSSTVMRWGYTGRMVPGAVYVVQMTARCGGSPGADSTISIYSGNTSTLLTSFNVPVSSTFLTYTAYFTTRNNWIELTSTSAGYKPLYITGFTVSLYYSRIPGNIQTNRLVVCETNTPTYLDGVILHTEADGGSVIHYLRNTNAGGYVSTYWTSDSSTGVIFKNGSTRSADGGVNTMTLRNDGGSLRLQSSGAQGIHVNSGNGEVSIAYDGNLGGRLAIKNPNGTNTHFGYWDNLNYIRNNTVLDSSYLTIGANYSFPYPLYVSASVSKTWYLGYYMNAYEVKLANFTGTWPVSIWATSSIVCEYHFGTVSDERIKKNIKPVGSMLDIINKIEVVRYDYIDERTNKPDEAGVIAQQLEKVFPNAVDITEGIIPCYMRDEVKHERVEGKVHVYMDTTDLKVGDKLKIYAGKRDEEKEMGNEVPVLEIGDTYVVIDEWKDYTDEDDLFLYGKRVSDFRNVDKSQLGIMALKGVQELSTQATSSAKQIQILTERSQILEEHARTLEKNFDEYKALMEERLNKLAGLVQQLISKQS